MRRITLCVPYYENPGMLAAQLAVIATYPEPVRKALRLFVVDDGSPTRPATFPAKLPCEARLYRMREDIRWNQDACRNLAVAEAGKPEEWLLLTDIDHLVPAVTMQAVQGVKLRPGRVYTFRRQTALAIDGGNVRTEPYKAHPNSWLLTKGMYDRIGGYDERFAGLYGTDGMFRSRAQKRSEGLEELRCPIVRVPRSVIPDASTTTYARKSPADGEGRQKVRNQIQRSGNHEPVRGRFAWDRIV